MCGLHSDPPANALALSIDENTSIQAKRLARPDRLPAPANSETAVCPLIVRVCDGHGAGIARPLPGAGPSAGGGLCDQPYVRAEDGGSRTGDRTRARSGAGPCKAVLIILDVSFLM